MKRMRKAISMLLMVAMLLADHSISAIATNTEVASENMRNTKILEHENIQGTLLSDNAVSMYEYTGEQLSNSQDTYLQMPASINDMVELPLETMAEETETIEKSEKNEVETIEEIVLENTESLSEIKEITNQEVRDISTNDVISTLSAGSDFAYTILNGTYCQITGYTGTATEISIPAEIGGYIVQSIGNSVFDGNTTLTAVAFPETIETIGEYAFDGCTRLTNVNIKVGLTKIYRNAFSNCSALVDIELPDTVEYIGYKAFSNCTKLSNITYPANLTMIGADNTRNEGQGPHYQGLIFEGCSNLKKIVIPEGVLTIPNCTFNGCTYLEEVVLPDTLSTIGNYAFYGCTGLKLIILPKEMKELSSSAFYGCIGLTSVEIPDSVKVIASHTFEGCSGLKNVVINKGTTTIDLYAFYGCSALTDVQLNEGLITIGSSAFSDCTALKNIALPSSITTIKDYAFENCSSLTDISMEEGLAEIERNAFTGCIALASIELPDSVEYIGYEAFSNCTHLSNINYPINWVTVGADSTRNEGKGPSYQGRIFAGCSNLKKIEIPEGVMLIPDCAFSGCAYLEKVLLPGTLLFIGDYSFNSCIGLRNIEISDNVEYIGIGAFRNCISLTKVELLNSVECIEREAFSGCTGLVSVVLSDNVGYIGYEAFSNCTKLSSINYPVNWVTAGTYSSGNYGPDYQGRIFAGCRSLTKIEIPDGVTEIPDCAFNGCTYLTEVVLPDTLTNIGKYAFCDCTGLKTINLVEGLTSIPKYCFYNCISLGKVVFPNSIISVEDYAYYNCAGLQTIIMNGGMKSIGNYAFSECNGVLSLSLNDGLQTILESAFKNCVNLRTVEIPASVTLMRGGVFDGCSKLMIYCYFGTQAHTVCVAEGYDICLLNEHSHEYITTIETAPTCTRGGSQILTCSICGYYYVDILEALGHEYSDTVVEPSCEEEGYTLHECLRGDDSYRDEIIPATGHNYGEWETVTEATCTKNGVKKRICKICKAEDKQVISALGHTYEEVVIPPTCTADGCTVHTCTVCNESYADNYVPALEHNFSEWMVSKKATLLECGVRSRSCEICSKEEKEEIEKITVDVENNAQYGIANFTVLDAVSLQPVSGASIFIKTESDGEATMVTDKNGKVSQILPVGQWQIAVYADGYLVRNITITVKAGEQDIPTIGISDKPLVDAVITTTEMTYEEMVEAGIAVDSSENKHYYKYEVTIRFHEEMDISFVSYGDGEGNIISTSSSSDTTQTVYALSHDGDEVDAEAVTITYSEEYGTYIADRTSYANAVWMPTIADTIAFQNNDYYFEGYGIPSTLKMTTNRAFSKDGWTFNSASGRLSMSVGERTHYLTFRDGKFCTVSNAEDSIPISLFERISSEGYPTKSEYVYIPAKTIETGKQYLLVQFKSVSSNEREALSHDADQPYHETVTIYGDDEYGQYIADSGLFENTVWRSSVAKSGGLKLVNNHYFAQVEDTILQYMPLANEQGWVLNGEYLTTTIGEDTYYLRYNNGEYHVTDKEEYAGKVMLFEKTTVTDVVSGNGQTNRKTIYRHVCAFEEGKEYIIVGSAKNPSSQEAGGYSGGYGGGFSGKLSDGTQVTIYPVSEKFYLIIYGEVCWIKEMFDVEMLILNRSATDTIENCVAELILPEGLSLATMVEGEQSAVQTVGHIAEGGSHSLHWYVRGDEEGSYNITATLNGIMMPFKEEFHYEYEADSPIKVYAGSAMKMTIHIPENAYNEAKYVIKMELENVSDKVLYGITNRITGWEQGKIEYYSDGKDPVEIPYGSGGFVGSTGIDAFYPGDKIVLEVGFDILFESSIRKNLMETANQVEELHKAYEAVNTALNLMKSLNSFCNSASKALNEIVSADAITDAKKKDATIALIGALDSLIGKFEKGDSKAVAMANNMQSGELYSLIKKCSTAAGCADFIKNAEDAKTILSFANKIKCLLSEEESAEKPYNAFDSLRTMISTIPIKYVVEEVMVSTMDSSTTAIPYSVVLTPTESPYMGVDNWGKYIYNWMITAMGKISSPWYAQMFAAPKDVTGYDDAVSYVKQVEKQIAAYNVHKAPGTTFRAWIEHATDANARIAAHSSSVTDGSFLLETDNETAAYENGVLTFTGNAILEVTALSTEDGILYIEDDEGNIKTIVIDTVEAHTCYSDTWNVEIAPSENFDGYRSKACDICGDIIAVETLTVCEEHNFGEWITEKEATKDTMGIRYRECQKCFAREIEYLPIVSELLNMKLVQYGTGMAVVVDGIALTNQQTADISVGGTFTVASVPDSVVAYSIDGGKSLIRLEGSPVPGEQNKYQFTLPDSVEQDISLYVILHGDATGDGEVDVFDFYEMLSFLEGEDLEGIFYLASCVTSDEEVDLFDVFALLDYIETGSFGEEE